MSDWLNQQQGKDLPTAFTVGGDFMAAGAISALQNHGLRVPQDVSVMSIDGFNGGDSGCSINGRACSPR